MAVLQLLAETWEPGAAFGDAFARMLMRLVGQYGLILLDPRDPDLKELAAPLYAKAAERAPEIAVALEARSDELVAGRLSRAGARNGRFVPALLARRRWSPVCVNPVWVTIAIRLRATPPNSAWPN